MVKTLLAITLVALAVTLATATGAEAYWRHYHYYHHYHYFHHYHYWHPHYYHHYWHPRRFYY